MKVFKNRKIWLVACGLWLVACGLLLVESKEAVSQEEIEVVKGEIAGQAYYVPKSYFKFSNRYFTDDNINLQFMNPDFQPLSGTLQNLWEKREYYKNVSVLANSVPKPIGAHKFANVRIESLKATEIVGEEYGLIHQKQPKEEIQDFEDVWLEEKGGEYLSIIECSEKIIESAIPQCSYHLYWESFHIAVDFDKRLLPEWKKIKNNTLALLESFKSEETARAFLEERWCGRGDLNPHGHTANGF